MKHLNGFTAEVPESFGNDSDGHVYVEHGQHFTVKLSNHHKKYNTLIPCDATIVLNGKDVGTFRIPAGQSITIERPSNDSGQFTAYSEDSYEAASIGIDRNSQSLGLIEVRFRPGNYKERRCERGHNGWNTPVDLASYPDINQYQCRSFSMNQTSDGITTSASYCVSNDTQGYNTGSCCNMYSEPVGMGIGLSGHSNQSFTNVDNLDYNEPETIIYLRLVKNSNNCYCDARPIKQVYRTDVPRKL